MSVTVYEPIIHGGMVEDAARETLKKWLPAYLAEMERQTGRKPRSLPEPRSFEASPDVVEKRPEQQLPALIIIAGGLVQPRQDGQGRLNARFAIDIAVVVSARDEQTTRELAQVYGAAVRTLILQRPSLGAFASGVQLTGEDYYRVPNKQRRTLQAAQVSFLVDVLNVSHAAGGPVEVPADPYTAPPGWPAVETVDIDIEEAA